MQSSRVTGRIGLTGRAWRPSFRRSRGIPFDTCQGASPGRFQESIHPLDALGGSSHRPMSKLDAALARLRENEGVEQLILLGRDGLVVTQVGVHPGEDEPVAARIPGLALACEALGK